MRTLGYITAITIAAAAGLGLLATGQALLVPRRACDWSR
jgi:hypothetical protein